MPITAGCDDRGASAALGCGTGLHREQYDTVLRDLPPVPWFELTENASPFDTEKHEAKSKKS